MRVNSLVTTLIICDELLLQERAVKVMKECLEESM